MARPRIWRRQLHDLPAVGLEVVKAPVRPGEQRHDVVVPLELRDPRGKADSRLRRSNLDLSQLGARSSDLSVRQHADELIAAVAQDGVLRPQAMFQGVAQAAKQGIAGGVALAVVGLLQPVEVDERDRQRRLVAARARYLTLCDRGPG